MEIKEIYKNYPQIRFCRIQKGTKKPFENDWTNKLYKWEEIENYFPNENYGVLCGNGDLAVIDSDKKELQNWVEKNLPETLRIKTGNGGTHNYYFIPELKNKIILEAKLQNDVSIHFGEVQSYGTQVVGAGSLHPNGNTYQILNELPIAKISIEQLYSAIKPFLPEVKQSEESKEVERKTYGSRIDDLRVIDIFGTLGLKKHKEEWFGSHPIHGSDSGMNFWINESKNLWHCFRCGSGGGVLSAIAVKHGIIQCSEARSGLLRGDKAIECIKIARDSYGLHEEVDPNTGIIKSALSQYVITPNDYTLIHDKDLSKWENKEIEWLVDKLIPSCGIGVWTGKRSTFKTFTALDCAYSIASGLPYLDHFYTKQCNVLYLDKENGVPIIQNRVKVLKKGRGIESESYPVCFLCFSTLKLDKKRDIEEIGKIIEKEHIGVIFVDTYRRAITFDENDAGEVSKLFVDTLRPLVEKFKVTIILIHHDKKSNGENGQDEMEQIRGSSDLSNYADFILKNKRGKDNTLILEQIKNRNAPELKPIKVSYKTDEETFISFKNEGEYTPQTADEHCTEVLLVWINKNGKKEFTTKEAKEIAFNCGIKKTNFYNGLNLLENRNFIKRMGGYNNFRVLDQKPLF